MGTLANSEDPDEMLQNAAFFQGLHLHYLEFLTSDASICTMNHPQFYVSNL